MPVPRWFAICFSLACAAAAQPPAARETLFPPWPALWSNTDTKPRDCHLAVVEPSGRKIVVGVETLGDARTHAARQAIVLIVQEKGFWSDPVMVSAPGAVYFPALAVDGKGKAWVAWSEFDGRRWKTMARDWERGRLGTATELSGGEVNLQPALAASAAGEMVAAWQALAGGRFEIRGRAWKNGAWGAVETIARGGSHDFRPALAFDSNGTLWAAWDRATESRYQTLVRSRGAKGWSVERPAFPAGADTRVPRIAADGSGQVWVLASGRLAGFTSTGERVELTAEMPKWTGGPDFLSIDGRGRIWLFKSLAERASFDWLAAWRNARMGMAVIDAQGLHVLPEPEAALGYQAPQVDSQGNVWAMNTVQLLRFAAPFATPSSGPSTRAAPLRAAAAQPVEARAWPRHKVAIGGATHQVYWAEMHNHLLEIPNERVVASWVDRLYLSGRYRDGLDMVALTDHDWPGMTRSMFYVEQAIGNALNASGRFLAFNGYEWSGDSQTRARFGDRTVLFPDGYHDIARITDDAANDAAKLSASVKRMGALDWPHHIGRAESPVHPSVLQPATEPVIEMTSGHGVFETYDPAKAVPIPFKSQIIPGTSVQDILAAGKRVGMVGSSDSHSGFSGYRTGMFGVAAPELTRTAILNAIRARRTWAIRGGQPIFVDFRADDRFTGDEYRSASPPRIRIAVEAARPVTRIELVRNNRWVFAEEFRDGAVKQAVEFRDTEAPPAFYYARVSTAGGGYAWTSPIWVDRPLRTQAFPPWTVAGIGAGGLLMAAAVGFRKRRR